jgi:conjugal transfer pilus assembly protein TraD
MIQDYEMPWRKVYESYSAIGWLLCFFGNLYIIKYTTMPKAPFLITCVASIILFVYRLYQSDVIWHRKLNLMFKPLDWITSHQIKQIIEKTNNEYLYLGTGYNWNYTHTQRNSDIRETPDHLLVPPAWYFKMHGRKIRKSVRDDSEMGNPLIHGIETNYKDIIVPLKHTNSHTLIVGTTGSIKTRLYELLVTQAIHRKPKECIIIIDPKGDIDLVNRIKLECKNAGRENDFHYFHPSFSRSSVRINPVKNFNRPEEIANRIASLLPSESGSDPFVETSWRVVDAGVQCMLMLGITPTIQLIAQSIETGLEGYLVRVLKKYFSDNMPNWKEEIANIEMEKQKSQLAFETQKLISFYIQKIQDKYPNSKINSIINVVTHDRAHLSKLITSLMPLLQKLGSGEVGSLLSPNAEDLDDDRPLLDTSTIVKNGQILYLALDSLPDASVGSAIGSIFLADLAAVAGDRYNFNAGNLPVNVYVDEANECINIPFVQIMNKARGANFSVTFALQTIPDLIDRCGSKELAYRYLGNANNFIAGRVMDEMTREYLVKQFGMTSKKTLSHSMATQANNTTDTDLDFKSGVNRMISKEEAELINQTILGEIPNLEYIGSFSGGRIVKGRIPLIKKEVA